MGEQLSVTAIWTALPETILGGLNAECTEAAAGKELFLPSYEMYFSLADKLYH